MNQCYTFFGVSLLSFFIDVYMDKLNLSLFYFSILAIHHVMSTYLWLGSVIFKPTYFHLFALIATLIGWLIYKRCILTIVLNKRTGMDIDRPHKDLMHYLLLDCPEKFFYLLGLLLIAYDSFYILKK